LIPRAPVDCDRPNVRAGCANGKAALVLARRPIHVGCLRRPAPVPRRLLEALRAGAEV